MYKADRDSIRTFVLFVILAILSFAIVFTSRQTQETVRKTDLIVQCTTPDTLCYKLSQQSAQQRLKESKAISFCIVEAISAYPFEQWSIHRDDLLARYNICVDTFSK